MKNNTILPVLRFSDWYRVGAGVVRTGVVGAFTVDTGDCVDWFCVDTFPFADVVSSGSVTLVLEVNAVMLALAVGVCLVIEVATVLPVLGINDVLLIVGGAVAVAGPSVVRDVLELIADVVSFIEEAA